MMTRNYGIGLHPWMMIVENGSNRSGMYPSMLLATVQGSPSKSKNCKVAVFHLNLVTKNFCAHSCTFLKSAITSDLIIITQIYNSRLMVYKKYIGYQFSEFQV